MRKFFTLGFAFLPSFLFCGPGETLLVLPEDSYVSEIGISTESSLTHSEAYGLSDLSFRANDGRFRLGLENGWEWNSENVFRKGFGSPVRRGGVPVPALGRTYRSIGLGCPHVEGAMSDEIRRISGFDGDSIGISLDYTLQRKHHNNFWTRHEWIYKGHVGMNSCANCLRLGYRVLFGAQVDSGFWSQTQVDTFLYYTVDSRKRPISDLSFGIREEMGWKLDSSSDLILRLSAYVNGEQVTSLFKADSFPDEVGKHFGRLDLIYRRTHLVLKPERRSSAFDYHQPLNPPPLL